MPEDWKTANAIPIYKMGSRTKAENFRPVSLTSQVCRIYESIIRHAMFDHLEGNKLIIESQPGFRHGKSCLSNLLCFLDKITRSLEEGASADAIYLDFAKVFDKVPHAHLLNKLRSHGIGRKLCNWIQEWLRDRKQRVRVQGSKSTRRQVWSGVRQGSVLGPVLFLIYLNDLDCEIVSWILKFAGDTILFRKIEGEKDNHMLQQDLSNLHTWSH